MINVENIAATLWNTVSAAAGLTSSNRRLVKWDEVAPAQMPFLCMSEAGIDCMQQVGMGSQPKWTFTFELFLYVAVPDSTVSPGTVLNPMITAVGATLDAPQSPMFGKPGTQTLGLPGVSHCWIEGKIATDEGVLGNKAIAIIPVKILATG